jgi:hypothetical protein
LCRFAAISACHTAPMQTGAISDLEEQSMGEVHVRLPGC